MASPSVRSFLASLAIVALTAAAARAQPGEPGAWLGVTMGVDAVAKGVEVEHVVRGSPADRAGIRAGDRLTSIDGGPVQGGADVANRVGGHVAGDRIEVTFTRNRETRTTHVALLPRPSPETMLRMDLVGAAAPEWRGLRAVSGPATVSAQGYRGRVVVLDFWATWCGPCRAAMPKLGALQSRYGAQGLTVVGVTSEGQEEVSHYVRRTGVPYALAIDASGETTRSYGISTLPTLIVIDKRGIVRDVSVGYDPGEDGALERAVVKLLGERSD